MILENIFPETPDRDTIAEKKPAMQLRAFLRTGRKGIGKRMKEIERIPLEGLHNTRDLGGFKTADGRKIRPHRLLRSGQLLGMTKQDERMLLEEYDLKTVVDFRTEREKQESPDPVPAGVAYYEIPILSELAVGITRDRESERRMLRLLSERLKDGVDAAAEYMRRLYRSIVKEEYSRRQYRRFFEILLKQEEGAVLWHCSAGKDRAGVGTAYVLWALGVPDETVYADYRRVNSLTGEAVEEQLARIRERIPDEGLLSCLRSLMQVQDGYLKSVQDEILQDYGSIDRFLEQEMGLDPERRARMQERYLEG